MNSVKNKVEFLGHIISKNGIEVNPNKIETNNNLKIPANVHELRRVLRFNFVTKFIPKAQENPSKGDCTVVISLILFIVSHCRFKVINLSTTELLII